MNGERKNRAAERAAAWRVANPERVREYRHRLIVAGYWRDWHGRHREREIARCRAWRAAHPEKVARANFKRRKASPVAETRVPKKVSVLHPSIFRLRGAMPAPQRERPDAVVAGLESPEVRAFQDLTTKTGGGRK